MKFYSMGQFRASITLRKIFCNDTTFFSIKILPMAYIKQSSLID